MAQQDSDQLILFAKAPRPGQVKTRLAASIGEQAALAAYFRLLQWLAESLRELRVTVLYSPSCEELQKVLPPHWKFQPQSSGDLGQRLLHALRTANVIVGSDCPYVTRSDIAAGWDALRSHDVVFGRAKDGGYWLIGARRTHPEMFKGVAWGGPDVLAQNLRACHECGLSTTLLRTLEDVDTIAEWRRFEETLRGKKLALR